MKLEFGTAGIRGILGEDENNLNETHIIRIIEGFSCYLISNFKNVQNLAIVVGRDNRRKSKRFSEIAASILSKHNIIVLYNKDIAPTPFISYAIRKLGAMGGVNITASHNPKEYNGVKLYDGEGCQLLPNATVKLLTYFKPYDFYTNTNISFQTNKFIIPITKKLMNSYLFEVKKVGGPINDLSNIKVAFTPQHGTGAKPVKELFHQLKVQAFFEEREMIEDAEFTYAPNPNPESKESFDNVMITAKKNDCDIILVTDPDSDRVGAAIKHNNKYQIITGNEMGTLIFDYLVNRIKTTKLNEYYLVYSFVSSSLPRKIAEAKGLKHYVTETGFKWIGATIENIKKVGKEQKFLFAFEESYGSLIDENICRDKDAIQSIVILTKMASFYKRNNQDLIEVLEDIYSKYGFVETGAIILNINSKNHLSKIKKSFKNLSIKHATFLDYNAGIRLINPSDMLAYEFDDGSWISLRPSGTEPKIKIYLFFISKTKNGAKQNYNKYFGLLSNM